MGLPACRRAMGALLACCGAMAALASCTTQEVPPRPTASPAVTPTAAPTIVLVTPEAHERMLAAVPALATHEAALVAALASSPPILPLDAAGLDENQRAAQSLALAEPRLAEMTYSVPDQRPLRSEVVAVAPLGDAERTGQAAACQTGRCYRVTMYNHAEHMTVNALVDLDRGAVVDVGYRPEAQPDINAAQQALAWEIALNTPAVRAELGIPASDDLPATVERKLLPSNCEQSRHLCAAPTFVVGDRALSVITDLTAGQVIALRWSGIEALDWAPPTEARLLTDYIDENYCRAAQSLDKDGWRMDYLMTPSDGLRLTDVQFAGRPVLQSAKVVDYHVSYSRQAGFGYSDAIGCPYFSSAAVPAMEPPRVEPIQEGGEEIGFALVQDFVNPLWPAACMYFYIQRYEFYRDGRFRVVAGSNGGGCGNDGTYRPVLRIVPAGDALTFSEWDGKAWVDWDKEGWRQQGSETAYTAEGFQYRLTAADGSGYAIEPGRGQFGDGGRGDKAFTFVTQHKPGEGDDDIPTIGPCCNTDHRQGPEQFIEPEPEAIRDQPLALWYVPEMKNDDTPGGEYCWARSDVVDGLYVTRGWPCFAGPMFVPTGR